MNPFAYGLRAQAKAIVGGLTTLASGLAAGGDPLVTVVLALAAFYAVFATPNKA